MAGCQPAPLTASSLSAVLLAASAIIERRARRPLVAPHTWKVVTLVAGTTVMDQVRQHGDHADRWHSRAAHLAVGHEVRSSVQAEGYSRVASLTTVVVQAVASLIMRTIAAC
jgi:hypothetical protein